MSRVIKFRAWGDESMLSNDQLTFVHLNGYESILCNILNGYDDVHKLMQFTGLQDKNGVDIYEGDIVQMYRHCDNLGRHKKAQRMTYKSEGSHSVYTGMENNIMKVSYAYGSLCLNASDGSTGLRRNFSSLARPGESMEVIGNIHQNPELLESK